MEVLTLLMFIGAVWVVSAIALFAFHIRTAHHEHADRLAILPLEGNWHDTSIERAEKAKSSAEDAHHLKNGSHES